MTAQVRPAPRPRLQRLVDLGDGIEQRAAVEAGRLAGVDGVRDRLHAETVERGRRALVVVGFVVSEWYGAKLAPAPAARPTADELAAVQAAELAEKRSAAARQAAATRKARAAEAAEARAAKNEARRLAAMKRKMREAFDSTDAPVSPAPFPTTYM